MNPFVLPASLPFVAALGVLLLLGLVEGLSLLFGASAWHWLDGMIEHEPPDGFLGWMHVGRAPLLVLLALLLTAFALTGFALNFIAMASFGAPLPPLLSAPVALLASLPAVRALGTRLARWMPREETYAVTFDSLVGRVAHMLGHARPAYPAQAKVADGNGHTLYLMVEPDETVDELAIDSDVLLVRQISGSRFAAIPNPRPDLLG
ncbi:OB-fold-containig protein [Rhodanobacter sp. IGA1.0]|uniref:OB-fold-containig protein n=1 Tax=Rhodanobacter sp. IGA1.0 TaxID=3158582 RepID=A0AAU7QMM1_9GAMM